MMLKILARLGFVEGLVFIVLLLVGLPLKYWFGLSEVVTVIGSFHGVTFSLYVAALIGVTMKSELPIWACCMGVIGALLPFGPFVFDQIVLERIRFRESLVTKP